MNYAWYYLCATLLVLCNLGALAGTAFALPGNWIIVLLTAVFAWLIHSPSGQGVSWQGVVAVFVLAILGEIIEFAAGAAGAARSGGSRRGIVLSLIGAFAGSLLGVVVGVPIPIVGSLVAAVGGGAVGAFVGAYVGEVWKGRSEDHSLAVGKAALIGRLLGTVGKLAIGAVMVVVAAADALFF